LYCTPQAQLQEEKQLDEVQKWQQTVNETLAALQAKHTESVWPRDILLSYLQYMERLQVRCSIIRVKVQISDGATDSGMYFLFSQTEQREGVSRATIFIR